MLYYWGLSRCVACTPVCQTQKNVVFPRCNRYPVDKNVGKEFRKNVITIFQDFFQTFSDVSSQVVYLVKLLTRFTVTCKSSSRYEHTQNEQEISCIFPVVFLFISPISKAFFKYSFTFICSTRYKGRGVISIILKSIPTIQDQ